MLPRNKHIIGGNDFVLNTNIEQASLSIEQASQILFTNDHSVLQYQKGRYCDPLHSQIHHWHVHKISCPQRTIFVLKLGCTLT